MPRPTVLKFVSFATPKYASHLTKLAESFAAMHYANAMLVTAIVPDKGSWLANCNHKSHHIYHELQRDPCPMVWVDADATFENGGDIAPLFDLCERGVDFAAHWPANRYKQVNSEMLSGTLFFSGSDMSVSIAMRWMLACKNRPRALDQDTLAEIVRNALKNDNPSPVCYDLDPRYVTIYDLMASVANPVIVHHQASRVHRD